MVGCNIYLKFLKIYLHNISHFGAKHIELGNIGLLAKTNLILI